MSLEPTQIEFSNESENETEKLSFHEACEKGNLKVVKIYLAQLGFNMNVGANGGRTGFHYACLNGRLNVIQFLVQKGCDMNVRNNFGITGFHYACLNGSLNVVQFLLQQGFEGINEPDVFGMTGLQSLINKRRRLSNNELYMPCILLLIESGAQMDQNDVFENLISAIENRIIEITFMKETIFAKWTGRIAQAITDYAIPPTSLQNLSQILD